MPNTLFGRLLISSLLVLSVFFSALGYVTKRVFVENINLHKREQLKLQNYILLTSTKIRNEHIVIDDDLRELRFEDYNSGLYGLISDKHGNILWRTYSANSLVVNKAVLMPKNDQKGASGFSIGPKYYRYYHTVLWEVKDDQQELLTFTVLEDRGQTLADIKIFENRLHLWFLLIGVVLVTILLLVLRWGTRPLRQVAKNLKRIESGELNRIEGKFPVELQGLTQNINELLVTEKRQRERYHYTLADLAHSLKTPLAVIQTELESKEQDTGVIGEQIHRMDEIIKHQLQRAVVSAPHQLGERTSVLETAERLTSALDKVYADRHIKFSLEIKDNIFFLGDKRDLTEILGNLLDNACKHCTSNVMVSAEIIRDALVIGVHDDGFGIDEHYREQLLNRGLRADTRYAGQGIGLDVARDIVNSYHGELTIGDSPLGGALFRIRFPH